MPFAGNVGGDLHAVGEPHTRDLSDSGVGLSGSLGRHTRAHASLKGRVEMRRAVLERVEAARERHGLRAPRLLLSPSPNQLIDRTHDKLKLPSGVRIIYYRYTSSAN